MYGIVLVNCGGGRLVGCGEQLTKTMLARECAECVKHQQDTTSALHNCFKHKFLGKVIPLPSILCHP